MNKKLRKVLILHGVDENTTSIDEKETIEQAETLKNIIANIGYKTDVIYFSLPIKNNKEKIKEHEPDIIFNLVDAIKGKGKFCYAAPLLFEDLGLTFTGCSSEAIRITTNKIKTKEVLKKHNLLTPAWLSQEETKHGRIPHNKKYIIKQVNEDCSIGLSCDSVVASSEEMIKIYQERSNKYKSNWFAEEFIDGREFHVSIIEQNNNPVVLPAAEILFSDVFDNTHKVFDYEAKWIEDDDKYKGTVRVFPDNKEDSKLIKNIKEICLSCWSVFKLSGYARIDFRIDSKNNPYILEINTNPCISPDASLAAAAEMQGLNYNELVENIILQAKKHGNA